MPLLKKSSNRSLLIFIGIFFVLAALYLGRGVLIPLALAIVFTFLLTPTVTWLEKRGARRAPAVLFILVICLTVFGGAVWLVYSQFMQITGELPNYKANLHSKIQSLRSPKGSGLSNATATVKELSKELTATGTEITPPSNIKPGTRPTSEMAVTRPIPVQVTETPTNIFQDLRTLLSPLVGPLETAGIVIIFTFFMLVNREDLRNRMIRLTAPEQLNTMTTALDDASARLSRYLRLQFLVNASYGVLFGTGLYFIGVPHAMLWGLLGGLLRFVPYVGTMISATFPVTLALVVYPGWTQAMLAVGLFLFVELTLANFIEPWLYGEHTGISSLAILVAAVFWALLWGPVGLFLSTPLTVCLLVLGRYVPALKFLDIALGDEPVLEPAALFYQRLLALDQDEARNIAQEYLKDHSLIEMYDAVLIPALSMAEHERHMNTLEDDKRTFIFQTATELVEELGERAEGDTPVVVSNQELAVSSASSGFDVVCVPARDEADAVVALMLAQLLHRSGYRAGYMTIGAVVDMLEKVARQQARVACVSALPPFALGQARSLCKALRLRAPGLKIIAGVWNYEGGIVKAQERLGTTSADFVCTSLVEALVNIRALSSPTLVAANTVEIEPTQKIPSQNS